MENKKDVSAKRKRFNKEHDGLTDSEIIREHLYAQQLIYDKLEKIRANTSNLVWFLIVIPIIVAVFVAIF